MFLAAIFDHPVSISVIVALIQSGVQTSESEDRSFSAYLARFNTFPLWGVVAISGICAVVARILRSAIFVFLYSWFTHPSHHKKDLPVTNQDIGLSDVGHSTATPVSPPPYARHFSQHVPDQHSSGGSVRS